MPVELTAHERQLRAELDRRLYEDILKAQNQHAILRKQAVTHLRGSDSPVARGFRLEYAAAFQGRSCFTEFKNTLNAYLNYQSNAGRWGSYIEATALGESLGVSVVVHPRRNGTSSAPVVLYKAGDTLDASRTVNLVNSDNVHWEALADVKQARVLSNQGGGDCLYRAFAQELRRIQLQPQLADASEQVVTKKPAQAPQQRVLGQQMYNDSLNAVIDAAGDDKGKVDRLLNQIINDRSAALKLAMHDKIDYRLPSSHEWEFLTTEQQLTELMHYLDGQSETFLNAKSDDNTIKYLQSHSTLQAYFNEKLSSMAVDDRAAFEQRNSQWKQRNSTLVAAGLFAVAPRLTTEQQAVIRQLISLETPVPADTDLSRQQVNVANLLVQMRADKREQLLSLPEVQRWMGRNAEQSQLLTSMVRERLSTPATDGAALLDRESLDYRVNSSPVLSC